MRAVIGVLAAMGWSVIGVANAFAAAPLADHGASTYQIVVRDDASLPDRRAADEIHSYLWQLAGVDVPVVSDMKALPAQAILVGANRHLAGLGVTLDAAKLGDEGFVLKTVGDRLVVAGTGARGTLYGSSELLECLGVRWFSPVYTRVPKTQRIELPNVDEMQRPAFEYREPFFTEAREKNWAAHLRMNGSMTACDDTTGGKIIYGRFVHTFDELVPRQLYGEHPEYFPLVKGVRKQGYVQRCLSNTDVLLMSVETVRQWMRQNPQAKIFSVSQNDVADYCECDACKAIASRYGGVQSGVYLWFVNQVAEAVEKEFPDKLIDTLAYQFTEQPPTNIKPRSNVRVRLCPISNCQSHPFDGCVNPASANFVSHLRQWSQLSDCLYIWHYNTNFRHYLLPFPDFNEFPSDFKLYRKSGVKGIFAQGGYAEGGGASDAVLRSYVMARLMWNPDLDANALVTEWMQGVYGPAWKPMRQWFDLLHEAVRTPDQHMGIYDPAKPFYLTEANIAAGERLMAEARQLAPDARTVRSVAIAELAVRYARIVHDHETGPRLRQFIIELRNAGIQNLSEGLTLLQWQQKFLEGKLQ